MQPFIVEPRRVFRWHCALIAAAAFAHWLVRIVAPPVPILDEEYVRMLADLNGEGVPASFFEALALLSCSLVAFHIRMNHPAPEGRSFWTVVGGMLLCLGFDEAAQVHEGFVVFGKHLVSGRGVFYFTWWPAYLPLVLSFVAILVPGLLRAPEGLRNSLLLGGAIFLGGAVGMEMHQGWLTDRMRLAGADRLALGVRLEWSVMIEETLEMLGVAVTLRGLLRHVAHFAPVAAVRIVAEDVGEDAAPYEIVAQARSCERR